MLSKNEIKQIRSLRQKKYRRQHNAFVVEGEKSVSEVVKSHLHILKVVHTPRMSHAVVNLTDVSLSEVDEQTMQSLSSFTTAAGILAVVAIPDIDFTPDRFSDTVLALDGITDPGNLGTIVRTADWFGITDILCAEDCVDLYNPKTVQATMGSLVRVRVHYVPLAETLAELQRHFELYGLAMEGAPLHTIRSNVRKILIAGSEANGISTQVASLTGKFISIPAYRSNPHKRPESLNVSIATAIACYELNRK